MRPGAAQRACGPARAEPEPSPIRRLPPWPAATPRGLRGPAAKAGAKGSWVGAESDGRGLRQVASRGILVRCAARHAGCAPARGQRRDAGLAILRACHPAAVRGRPGGTVASPTARPWGERWWVGWDEKEPRPRGCGRARSLEGVGVGGNRGPGFPAGRRRRSRRGGRSSAAGAPPPAAPPRSRGAHRIRTRSPAPRADPGPGTAL